MTETCATCHYYRTPPFIDSERCCRYPPVIKGATNSEWRWPRVDEYVWCGEWTERRRQP